MFWDDSTFAPHGATVDKPVRHVHPAGDKPAELEIPDAKIAWRPRNQSRGGRGPRAASCAAWGGFPGGHRSRVTPVPIPNTEVKPATADGTACVGAWESRSLPGIVHRHAATTAAWRPRDAKNASRSSHVNSP